MSNFRTKKWVMKVGKGANGRTRTEGRDAVVFLDDSSSSSDCPVHVPICVKNKLQLEVLKMFELTGRHKATIRKRLLQDEPALFSSEFLGTYDFTPMPIVEISSVSGSSYTLSSLQLATSPTGATDNQALHTGGKGETARRDVREAARRQAGDGGKAASR